jgi:hypothetical protein
MNSRGEIRKVGVELEFGGVSLQVAAEAVREAYGGEITQDHEHRYAVATKLGEFEVTYDSSLLSDKKYAEFVDKLGLPLGEQVKGAVERVVRGISGAILPLEIGTPPIPVTRLDELNLLEQALRRRDTEGTRAGLFYAFALHFNPEAVDPTQPLPTLRAFLLLYHWLFQKEKIDTTRRLLPFFDPFPEEYSRLVIDMSYAPSLQQFTDDYVANNPTRNRPLDLLPLLAFNDPELMKRPELEGQKVRPRPTYHYRLPNSLIDEPDWSISEEWNRWVLIERLACNPALTQDFSRAYLNWEDSIAGYLSDRWFRYVDKEWIPHLANPVA